MRYSGRRNLAAPPALQSFASEPIEQIDGNPRLRRAHAKAGVREAVIWDSRKAPVHKESAMKIVMFAAAALSMSGIALAQDSGAAAPPATTDQPSGVTTTNGNEPGNGLTQQGTDPSGQGVAPPGTNQPVVVPPGAVVVPNPNQAAAFTPQAATTDYPPCSKTVTDHCVQTYERGPGAVSRASTHHRKRR